MKIKDEEDASFSDEERYPQRIYNPESIEEESSFHSSTSSASIKLVSQKDLFLELI